MAKANTVSRNKKAVKTAIDDHVEWLDRRSEFTFELAEEGVVEYLAEDDVTALKVLPIALRQYASVHAIRGTVESCQRADDGWGEIDRSLTYRHWITRLEGPPMVERGDAVGLDFVFSPTASLLAFSLLYKLSEWERYFSHVLLAAATRPGMLAQVVWKDRFFEPFMLQWQQKLRGEPGLAHADFGPYAGVLEHWDSDRLKAEDLEAVCDYHCQNMIDKGGQWRYEFIEPPFDLYPVEVLAIYAVRQRLGLTTPVIDHPLLSTPLASTAPRAPSVEEDGVLTKVREIYQRVFG